MKHVRSLLLVLAWTLLVPAGWAAEPLAILHLNFVTVVITLELTPDGHATLVGTFTPDAQADPLHLYSVDLVGSIGVATRLEIKPGQTATALGKLVSDQTAHLTHDADPLLVYPPGPVTVHLPIQLPTGSGQTQPVTLIVKYMACTETSCKNPVMSHELVVALPTHKDAAPPPLVPQGAIDPERMRAIVHEELAQGRAALIADIATATALRLQAESAERSHIAWARPTTVAQVEAMISQVHAAGKAALLDFTGPSCVNCQKMEKTVFRLPAVTAAWNQSSPISISTDPPNDELADWQQKTFKTQNRPLYIRITPDGARTSWNEVFVTSDQEALTRFLTFLHGGLGADHGTGSSIGEFIWLALAGGLFTLLMPCTYPMIPLTVNVFAKQAAAGRKVLPLAAFYALGIVGCFVGVGVLITGVLGANLSTLAGHPVTNLVIGLLFLVLGLSLLGAFLLHLPSSIETRLGGGRSGYIGALLMGLTFAVTAFSCTAPFAGSVLAAAVSSADANGWLRAIAGMAIYSGAIAVPFFFLAISPHALQRLPKAGAWMNEFKVVGGLIEIAAALKFLAICDNAWGWGVIGRTFTFAAWAAISLVCAAYVIGRVRLPGDQQLSEVGVTRLLFCVLFFALGLWFVSGLMGSNLGAVESFFPGDQVPGR